jgi:hypothetical protein
MKTKKIRSENMRKILFTCCLLLAFSASVSAQTGREFWFAVPNITPGEDANARLTFVSYEQPVKLHIEQPSISDWIPINYDTIIPPNSYWNFEMMKLFGTSQVEVTAGFALPLGLHMTGDNDFSVYYANTSDDSEIFTLKGGNALGADFIVPMQYEYKSGTYYQPASNSIQIVATEDNTVVNIEVFRWTTDAQQTRIHDTITVTLDKGWAYAVESLLNDECLGDDHLHNTHIWSDKPIAVNSTDDSVGSGDMLGDQITPTNLAGSSYIAVRNEGNFEKVYIFPIKNNTNIYVDGTLHATLNKGDKTMIDLKVQSYVATYIEAKDASGNSLPVVAFQTTTKTTTSTTSNEPGGGVLPKLECTGSMETVYKRAFTSGEIYFNIITTDDCINDFTLNGQSGVITASDFSPVLGAPSEWRYCRKNLTSFSSSEGNGVLRLKNTKGYFHVAAYDNPSANSCTFGYFSDFHSIRFNTETSQVSYESGETIRLYMTNADAFTNIAWTKPDGSQVAVEELIIQNATEDDAGMYIVTGTSKYGCMIEEEGVAVVNIIKAKSSSKAVCEGESVVLQSDGIAPFVWLPDSATTTVPYYEISPIATTTYTVTNHKSGQNTLYNGNFQQGNNQNKNFQSDWVYVGTTATALPAGNYSVRSTFNSLGYTRFYDHTLRLSSGIYLLANCSAEAGKKIWKKTVDVTPNTTYRFGAWFSNAKNETVPVQLRFAFNGNPEGDVITPTNPVTPAGSVNNWKEHFVVWNSGNTTKAELSIVTIGTNADNTAVCIDDVMFSPYLPVNDTIKVNVTEIPEPEISGDTILCHGTATLDAGVAAETYKWLKIGSQTVLSSEKIFSPAEAGVYVVETSNGSCAATDTFSVAPAEILNVMMTNSTVAVCPDEAELTFAYQIEGKATYNVIFNNPVFTNIYGATADGANIVIPLPVAVPSGDYAATLKFASTAACSESSEIPLKITVKINPNSLVRQKWNDVLALYNPDSNPYGYAYSACQWYKNGEPIAGETGSYLYLGTGNEFNPADRYAVLLTLADGTTLMSCDFIPEEKQLFAIQNPVRSGQKIKLAETEELTGTAAFYGIAGTLYSVRQIENNHIVAPEKQGIYFLRFNGQTIKIIVQ